MITAPVRQIIDGAVGPDTGTEVKETFALDQFRRGIRHPVGNHLILRPEAVYKIVEYCLPACTGGIAYGGSHIMNTTAGERPGYLPQGFFPKAVGKVGCEGKTLVVDGLPFDAGFRCEVSHFNKAQICAFENACTQDHIAVGIPVIIVVVRPLELGRTLGQPCRHAYGRKRIGDDAGRETVEYVGAPHIFITEPLNIGNRTAAAALEGGLNLNDVSEFV